MEAMDGVAVRKKRTFLLPVVDTGCFCCDLDACCKVQGWLNAVGGGALVIVYLADLTIDNSNTVVTEDDKIMMTAVEHPLILSISKIILIIVHLALLVCAILFLKGIREKRPELMIHYIRTQMVFVVLGLIYSIVKAVETRSVLVFIFLLLTYCGLQYYMLLCSSSLHFKMCYYTESIELPTTYHQPPPYAVPPTGYAPPNATGYALPAPGYPAPAAALAGNPYATKPLDGSSPTLV